MPVKVKSPVRRKSLSSEPDAFDVRVGVLLARRVHPSFSLRRLDEGDRSSVHSEVLMTMGLACVTAEALKKQSRHRAPIFR